MTVPPVGWTIAGMPLPVADWSADAEANRGYGQMRGTLLASDARRIPYPVGQGDRVRGSTADGRICYDGAITAPPVLQGGLALFAAQGESVRAEKRSERRFYQTRDVSIGAPQESDPHNIYQQPHIIHVDVRTGSVLLMPEANVGLVGGEDNAVALWVAGGSITRVAYHRTLVGLGGWRNKIFRGTGPNFPSGATLVVDVATASTPIDQLVASGSDMVTISLAWDGGAATTGAEYLLLHNIRLNGLAAGDTYLGSQVVADIGGALGWDVSGVEVTGTNVLPLDWTEGSWADLLTYIAGLEDRVWGVWEDGKLTYRRWGETEWTCYQSDGARVQVDDREIFNGVVVKYRAANGAPAEVTVKASPDPLAGKGPNYWPAELADIQGNAELATAVANALLPQVAAPHPAGTVEAVRLYDKFGREATYEARPGDHVRVADLTDGRSMRIQATTSGPLGIVMGVDAVPSSASVLGGAALEAARAFVGPGELPTFEPAEEPAEGEGFLSEREQYLERLGQTAHHKHHGRFHRHSTGGFKGHKHHGRWHHHL